MVFAVTRRSGRRGMRDIEPFPRDGNPLSICNLFKEIFVPFVVMSSVVDQPPVGRIST